MVQFANDKEAIDEQRQKQTAKEELHYNDIRALMDTRFGRSFVYSIYEKGFINKTVFTGNSSTFFNEGKRALVLDIIKDIKKSNINMYYKMLRENEEGNDDRS